jgi:hypothetical protein
VSPGSRRPLVRSDRAAAERALEQAASLGNKTAILDLGACP